MRILGILVFVVVLLSAAGVVAWRAGVVAGSQLEAQPAISHPRLDGRISVRLHAHIVNPGDISRSHICDFWASIGNSTQHRLLAAHISIGSRTMDLPDVAEGGSRDVPIWTVTIPQEQTSCSQKARWFANIARQAMITSCAMEGATERQCRELMSVAGDFNYSGLRTDDAEAASAARAAADALRADNLAVGTSVAIPAASFFKLGFGRSDVQKNDQARALAAADEPFDPNNPVDVGRLEQWKPYATMDGPVTVLQVHLDKEQVADWYKVSLWANLIDSPHYEVIAWVPREDLDKARARQAAAGPLTKVQVLQTEKPSIAALQEN